MHTPENAFSQLSVIVIEDNPGDYLLIEDYLEEKFQTVTTRQFRDCQSASAYLQQEDSNCDLILLDLHLPDMRGLALIHKILAVSPNIPVIILTGYDDLPLAIKSLALGVYDFLVKDEINPSLLYKSIEFAISRSSYVKRIESQNEKLKKIAWTQSHVVRAPVARILGIIYMLEEKQDTPGDILLWLKHLKDAVNEMDAIVKKIVHETQDMDTHSNA